MRWNGVCTKQFNQVPIAPTKGTFCSSLQGNRRHALAHPTKSQIIFLILICEIPPADSLRLYAWFPKCRKRTWSLILHSSKKDFTSVSQHLPIFHKDFFWWWKMIYQQCMYTKRTTCVYLPTFYIITCLLA